VFLQATGGNRRAASIPAPIAANGQHADSEDEEEEDDDEEVGLLLVETRCNQVACAMFDNISRPPGLFHSTNRKLT
jgi:hypothetical protein